MSREKPEKPDRRSRTRRILDWIMPHPHMMFRTDRSFYVRLMPELKELETPRDREKALGRASRVAIDRNPRAWLFLASCFTVYLVFLAGVIKFRQLLSHPNACFMLTVTCFMIGFILLPLLVFQSRIRRDLRRQLFEQGHPICIPCGYNLTGNDSGRCPECGWEIDRGDGLEADSGR